MKTTFKIYRDDDLPAFAGWVANSLKSNNPTILMNVEITMSPWFDQEDGNEIEIDTNERKLMIIENLMHEFGHAMQEYLDREFNEEELEKIIEDYREVYMEKYK